MAADALIADKAYDADKRVLAGLAAAGKAAVMPSKAHRKIVGPHDKKIYKAQHLTDNFLPKSTDVEIATNCHGTAGNFLGVVRLAAVVVWLN